MEMETASQSRADCTEGIWTSAAPAGQWLLRCVVPYPAAQKVNPAAAAAPEDDEGVRADHAGSDVSDENQSEDDAPSKTPSVATAAAANDTQLPLPRGVAVRGLPAGLTVAELRDELLAVLLPFGPIATLRINGPLRRDSATVIFHSGEAAARAVGSNSSCALRPLLLREAQLRVSLCSSSTPRYANTPAPAPVDAQPQKQQLTDIVPLPPILQPRPAEQPFLGTVPALPPIQQQSPFVGCGHIAIRQPPATRSSRRRQRGVAVLGLPPNFRVAELRRELCTVFQPFGRIVRIDTPGPDYAFVIFESGECAEQAVGCYARRPLVLGGYRVSVRLRHRPNTP